MSEGVTGSDGGGGRLINVGALDIAAVFRVLFVLVRKVAGVARSSSSAAMASGGAVGKDVSLSSRRGVVRD